MNFLKVFTYPFIILGDIWKFFVIYMPGGFGAKLRYIYYKNRFKACGTNVIIDAGVHIDGAELISIGNDVLIDKNCIISTGEKLTGKINRKPNSDFKGEEGEIIIGNDVHLAQCCILMGYGGISIGDNCVLSSGCKIYSLTNTAYDPEIRGKVISIMPYHQAPFLISSVVFRKNVWLGLNSIVMPSVTIAENSFSVSNSVIVDSFEENSYLSGNPARRVRNRFNYDN